MNIRGEIAVNAVYALARGHDWDKNKTRMVKIFNLGPNTNPLAMPVYSDGLKR